LKDAIIQLEQNGTYEDFFEIARTRAAKQSSIVCADGKPKKKNPHATAISLICQMHEQQIMKAKTKFTKQSGFQVATDQFDGHYRSMGDFDYQKCSDFVYKLTRFRVQFIAKPFKIKELPTSSVPAKISDPDRKLVLFDIEGVLGTFQNQGTFSPRPHLRSLIRLRKANYLIGIWANRPMRRIPVEDIHNACGFEFDVILSSEYSIPITKVKNYKKPKIKQLAMLTSLPNLLMIDSWMAPYEMAEQHRVKIITRWRNRQDDGALLELVACLEQKWVSAESSIPDEESPTYSEAKLMELGKGFKTGDSMELFERDVTLELNKCLAYVRATKIIVYERISPHEWIPRSMAETKAAFDHLLFRLPSQKGKEIKCHPVTIWNTNASKRHYNRVDFDPTTSTDTTAFLNIFTGLEIPREQSVKNKTQAQLVIDHILNIWCLGDANACKFVLCWMAFLVQNPGVKTDTAICLFGQQGAGKGVILELLAQILGKRYYFLTNDVGQIFGDYQPSALRTNLLLFLDECTYNGDKRQASKIKCDITAPTRFINEKWLSGETFSNHSNFVFASNEESFIRVEEQDRRYFPLTCNNKYAGIQNAESKLYFTNLRSVDPRHFAYYLYHLSLTDFNPRAIISTPFSRHQKLINFETVMLFIDNFLRLPDWDTMKIPGDIFYGSYIEYCNLHRASLKYKPVVSTPTFWATMRNIFSCARKRAGSGADRERFILFGSRSTCRNEFLQSLHETDWGWSDYHSESLDGLGIYAFRTWARKMEAHSTDVGFFSSFFDFESNWPWVRNKKK
jgi:hypothetical protein